MKNFEDQFACKHTFEAVVWSLPAVNIYGIRKGVIKGLGMKDNEVMPMSKPISTRHELLTANNTTPYTIANTGLRNGPVVVEIPDLEGVFSWEIDKALLYDNRSSAVLLLSAAGGQKCHPCLFTKCSYVVLHVDSWPRFAGKCFVTGRQRTTTLRLGQRCRPRWYSSAAELTSCRALQMRIPPTLVPMTLERSSPFPLSDIQQAYWVGRTDVVELGGVTTHLYCELDCEDIDLERLDETWRRLVERHDVLRSNVTPDGRQYVVANPPEFGIRVLDLRGEPSGVVAAQLAARRDRFSHEVRRVDECPAMRVRATRIGDDRFRLHLSADVLFVDARSRALLFSEWKQLYQNGKALREPQASFRDYVLEKQAQRQHPEYLSAREFWARRIETLPHAPDLPLAKSPEAIGRPRFERHESPLDAEPWARLRRRAETREIRPAVLLLAAFAEVLRAWSRSRQFTINLTLFDRLAREPRFHNVAGDFTSSLLLAVEPRGNQTLKERVSNLQQVLRECLRHSAMSGVEVIREHLRRTSGGHPALMPVVFTSFLAMERDLQEAFLPTWLGTPVYEITQTPQVWLDMQVRAQAGALYLAWDVVRGLFPDGMIADMFGSLVRLLLALADDDAAWSEPWEATVRRLLPTSQRERRAAYNATLTNVPGGGLHEPFFKQAARRPNHPALITPDKVLSYGELQARALRLAEILKPDLSGSDTLIAVAMKRGWEQVVGVLGVLASGAAYLPVDPDLPSERVRLLLEDGRVDTVLTQSHVSDRNDWPRGIRRICVDRLDSSPASGFAPQRPRGCELAYVIYTSGTTGRPKGVMVEHTAALNTVLDINTRFGIGPDDCVLAVSALSFDLSVYDLFGALATGGSIVFPAAEHSGEPAGWAQLIRLHSVTVWNSVPTLMMLLLEHLRQHPTPSPSSLRLVLLSGDWIPVRLPDQIRTEFPQARVVGLGGATEAAIWSIHYPVERVDPAWPSIPYGRPLSNQRVHVLNTALETCPDWVAGDLYIGGQGLARGYWRDPGLTAERFVVHPATGERLYHTGDMGRFLPEGDIEFLGREDAQVKVQGFRVELGEIESTLAEHPAVKSCVVTAHGSVEEGRRLVAHVVPEAGGRPAAEELRRFLDTRLPRYMVPSTFHFVSALPTGPTGKVDRKALSAVNPDVVEPAARPDADGTGVVHTIVGELAGILGVERETNLLAFGLTSVDIIRIANRVEAEFGIRVPLGEFYRDPNVRYLERLIAGRGLGAEQPDDVRRSSLGYHAQPQSQLLLDPLEREAFKNSRRSMRHFDAEVPTIALRGAPVDDNRGRQSATRRSHRRFSDRPLALVALDGLLDMLRAIPVQGGTKRRYGSAGGLYPIQTYLFVRDGKVEGLAAGTYYHNPWTHQLAAINDSECIQASAYDPFVNGPLFEASAFALFLVADLDAIAPLYGDRSAHYATIEAGLICQLLETEGPSFGIGLCQVGEVEYTTVHRALRLEGRHWFVHSLLGGPIDTADEWVPHTESYCVAQTGDDAKCSERRPLAVRGDGS